MIITTSISRATYQYVCNYNYTQQHADDLKKKFNTASIKNFLSLLLYKRF